MLLKNDSYLSAGFGSPLFAQCAEKLGCQMRNFHYADAVRTA